MPITYYMLDAQGNHVPTKDVLEWARWTEKADQTHERQVGDDTLYGLRVSTVFLGIPHCSPEFSIDTMDFLYETMIFGDEDTLKKVHEFDEWATNSIFGKALGYRDYQRRYQTKQEAIVGHRETVEMVRRALDAAAL